MPARHHAERTLVDPISTINDYLGRADWRVNANANQGYSVGGLVLNSAGKLVANYWLDEVFSEEAGRAHREGDLYIHDLDMLTGRCKTSGQVRRPLAHSIPIWRRLCDSIR